MLAAFLALILVEIPPQYFSHKGGSNAELCGFIVVCPNKLLSNNK